MTLLLTLGLNLTYVISDTLHLYIKPVNTQRGTVSLFGEFVKELSPVTCRCLIESILSNLEISGLELWTWSSLKTLRLPFSVPLVVPFVPLSARVLGADDPWSLKDLTGRELVLSGALLGPCVGESLQKCCWGRVDGWRGPRERYECGNRS